MNYDDFFKAFCENMTRFKTLNSKCDHYVRELNNMYNVWCTRWSADTLHYEYVSQVSGIYSNIKHENVWLFQSP